MTIKLGSTCRDKITSFEGIATGKATYLTGCDQYLLNPPSKDGALRESAWFDEQRLEVLGHDVVELDNSRGFGAPKR